MTTVAGGDFSPPLRGGGGCAIKKSRAASSARADGAVTNFQNKFVAELDHHPVRSIEEASRHFIEVADTPPRRGGENSRPQWTPNHTRHPQYRAKRPRYVVFHLPVRFNLDTCALREGWGGA